MRWGGKWIFITYNFSHFAIHLPNILTIDKNLTKFWQKQFCTVLSETPCRWWSSEEDSMRLLNGVKYRATRWGTQHLITCYLHCLNTSVKPLTVWVWVYCNHPIIGRISTYATYRKTKEKTTANLVGYFSFINIQPYMSRDSTCRYT